MAVHCIRANIVRGTANNIVSGRPVDSSTVRRRWRWIELPSGIEQAVATGGWLDTDSPLPLFFFEMTIQAWSHFFWFAAYYRKIRSEKKTHANLPPPQNFISKFARALLCFASRFFRLLRRNPTCTMRTYGDSPVGYLHRVFGIWTMSGRRKMAGSCDCTSGPIPVSPEWEVAANNTLNAYQSRILLHN